MKKHIKPNSLNCCQTHFGQVHCKISSISIILASVALRSASKVNYIMSLKSLIGLFSSTQYMTFHSGPMTSLIVLCDVKWGERTSYYAPQI